MLRCILALSPRGGHCCPSGPCPLPSTCRPVSGTEVGFPPPRPAAGHDSVLWPGGCHSSGLCWSHPGGKCPRGPVGHGFSSSGGSHGTWCEACEVKQTGAPDSAPHPVLLGVCLQPWVSTQVGVKAGSAGDLGTRAKARHRHTGDSDSPLQGQVRSTHSIGSDCGPAVGAPSLRSPRAEVRAPETLSRLTGRGRLDCTCLSAQKTCGQRLESWVSMVFSTVSMCCFGRP